MRAGELLKEFSPVTTEQWEETIARDLKGADYKKLIWRTPEGFPIKPYYRAEDVAGLNWLETAPGVFPFVRGIRAIGDWSIREEIEEKNPEDANKGAREAIAAGAEEIAFECPALRTASDLGMLFSGLPSVPLHFDSSAEEVIRLLSERRYDGPLSAGFDPLSNLEFAAELLGAECRGFVPFCIDAARFEESGANTIEETGFALSAGIDYLAEMQKRKIPIDRAAQSVAVSFAIGSSFFVQIAKFRAFRMLWARVVEAFGGSHSSAGVTIHARTSQWNETIYDPYVNVLRATTEAMSAIIGGANSISIAPFDESYRAPGPASRRLARNVQLLLKHEAHMGRVADPAAGAYGMEVITEAIAREGWKSMQAIESAGGFRMAEKSGMIASALQRSSQARREAVCSRRRVLTGTNQFANASESALDRIDTERPAARERGAQAYETLRLRTERHARKTGFTPSVLLAEIGDARMRGARSAFAMSFFGCAGFNVLTRSFASAAETTKSDESLIVLCSSDQEYLSLAEELLRSMKGLGDERPVLIAGNPETTEQLRACGVADFIHVRSNAIEVLTKWQQRLGIRD